MRKVIIPAAGSGMRMLPYTKLVPKEILPIINIPAINFILEECSSCNLTDIAFVVNETKGMLINHVFSVLKTDFTNLNVTFLEQKEQKGTADVISNCRDFLGENDFAVMFPDEISFCKKAFPMRKILQKYYETNSFVLGVKKVKKELTCLYGIVEFKNNERDTVRRICEKPLVNPPSEYALCGRYVCKKEIMPYLNRLPAHGKEQYITDAFNIIAENSDIYVSEIEGDIYDLGTPDNYAKTICAYSEKFFIKK